MTAIPLIGQVVTTTRVNLRQGAANTKVPVLRKVEAGTPLPVQALVVGETVQGNAHWYLTGDATYVWAGGCGPFKPADLPTTDMIADVVDLYHLDAVSSFSQARAAGLLGVIHKATTGPAGQDSAYAKRRGDAHAAGLLWGAYHWGTDAPIDDQVKNFLDTAQPDAQTLVALDYEKDPNHQMTLAGARAFLEGIQAALNRRAVIYSGSTLKEALGSTKDAFFGGHRLWLAQYGTQPKVQASWSSYWLWQYTDGEIGPDPKKVPGIPGDSNGCIDCDHFVGTEEQLRAEWAS